MYTAVVTPMPRATGLIARALPADKKPTLEPFLRMVWLVFRRIICNPLHTVQEHFRTDKAGGQAVPIYLNCVLIDFRCPLRLRPDEFDAVPVSLIVAEPSWKV